MKWSVSRRPRFFVLIAAVLSALFVGLPLLSSFVDGWDRTDAGEIAVVRHGGWFGDRNIRAVTLITDGPFRYVRHPIYALQMLLMGCSLVVVPTVPMLAMAAVHVVLVHLKASNEERHLGRMHGDAYRRYAARTGRFLPWPSAESR